MTTTEQGTELPEKVKPSTIESVKFRDGMIVTADDLDAAMQYPASLLRVVLRSYFGCGVMCGLGLRVRESVSGHSWSVCVDRGVAIDCRGNPIELCSSVELDLSPDPCSCVPPPEQVCIAVRRTTSDQAPTQACSCDVDDPRFDCRRVRDHVVVKAFSKAEFDALPGTVCRRPATEAVAKDNCDPHGATTGDAPWSDALCDALTACPPAGCGECWVLLGCLTIKEKEGIVGSPDTGGRRWVRPLEALCTTVVDRIKDLEDKVTALSQQVKDPTPPDGQTSPTA